MTTGSFTDDWEEPDSLVLGCACSGGIPGQRIWATAGEIYVR